MRIHDNQWCNPNEPYNETDISGNCPHHEWGLRKDGKPNKYPKLTYHAKFTYLKQCRRCKRVSTPKRIQYRAFFGQNKEPNWEHGYYCIGCWNILRVIDKELDETVATKKVINKLFRQIKDKRKSNEEPIQKRA